MSYMPNTRGQNNGVAALDSVGNILVSEFNSSYIAWFLALPVVKPAQVNLPWNNGGILSFS